MGICAVILTKNEERRIRRCLDSLKSWVDEIIIVDDESSDATVAIARGEYGARVIIHPLQGAFDRQRNLGMEASAQGWVLQMDADEVIAPQTQKAICQAVQQPGEYEGFEILRQDCVGDVPLKYVGGCYQLKLLRKGSGKYEGNIHETFMIKGPIGRIHGPVWHYAIDSVRDMISRHNHYSDLESQKYLRENPDINADQVKNKLIFKPFKTFVKHYLRHGGFKDGVPGLIWSMIHTLHPMMFWLKVLEGLQKNFAITKGPS
jgi:glycosyltransferase involved in cell wall biosynthesis